MRYTVVVYNPDNTEVFDKEIDAPSPWAALIQLVEDYQSKGFVREI